VLNRDFESVGRGRSESDCPDPLVWYEIASGELASEPTQKYVHHATGCDYCGDLLSKAVSDLNDDTTPAEAKQIAALESSRPKWQRRLAQRIAGTLTSDSSSVPWW
jgi:hypothetical protein